MKRRILLVDDEVAVLLTLKAVLEISGFDVDTAASAREGKSRLKNRQYDMIITDMRMESDESGREVILAARTAPYHPAVALITAYPIDDEDWQNMGADQMLVKPMATKLFIRDVEKLLENHQAKLKKLEANGVAASHAAGFAAGLAAGKTEAKAQGKPDAEAGTDGAGAAPEAKQVLAKKKTASGKKIVGTKAAAGKKTGSANAKKRPAKV